MRKDNIHKYILSNIPYLFVLWACLKAGTAYRLAAGADLARKLVGMTATLGPMGRAKRHSPFFRSQV